MFVLKIIFLGLIHSQNKALIIKLTSECFCQNFENNQHTDFFIIFVIRLKTQRNLRNAYVFSIFLLLIRWR